MPEASIRRVRSARQLLAVGVTLAVAGIAMSLGRQIAFAGVMTVAGLLLSIAGIHQVGRLGPSGFARSRREKSE